MARYKGNYKDLFQGEAKYEVTLKETKTVKGQSNSYFHAGMNMTVNSGTLEIKADTLDETHTEIGRDVDSHKNTFGWVRTNSDIKGNINLYAAFFLTCGATNSIGTVVTSNGKVKWQNLNRIQILVGAVSKNHTRITMKDIKNSKIVQGLAVIRNKMPSFKKSPKSSTN